MCVSQSERPITSATCAVISVSRTHHELPDAWEQSPTLLKRRKPVESSSTTNKYHYNLLSPNRTSINHVGVGLRSVTVRNIDCVKSGNAGNDDWFEGEFLSDSHAHIASSSLDDWSACLLFPIVEHVFNLALKLLKKKLFKFKFGSIKHIVATLIASMLAYTFRRNKSNKKIFLPAWCV